MPPARSTRRRRSTTLSPRWPTRPARWTRSPTRPTPTRPTPTAWLEAGASVEVHGSSAGQYRIDGPTASRWIPRDAVAPLGHRAVGIVSTRDAELRDTPTGPVYTVVPSGTLLTAFPDCDVVGFRCVLYRRDGDVTVRFRYVATDRVASSNGQALVRIVPGPMAVRAGPGLEYPALEVIARPYSLGRLRVYERSLGWYRLRLSDRDAWVAGSATTSPI